MSRLRRINISFYVLCQDCLRIALFDLPKHQEQEFCECGGQWCGCEDCNDTARQLLAGVRDQQVLGLRVPIQSWSPTTGVHMKVEATA